MEQGNAVLVDVRTPVEFRALHAENAVNVPLDTINEKTLGTIRNGHGHAPVYLMCRTGNRAGTACEKLTKSGGKNVFVVDGGAEAWEAAGLPVVRGKKAVSLERQVRIAAGSIVVIGAALAAFVHPWFWVVPAFIGSGLVFSGVTDTCGMGMVLARMPWNRATEQTCTS
jgi:rhodanese-related sulfurtransferase